MGMVASELTLHTIAQHLTRYANELCAKKSNCTVRYATLCANNRFKSGSFEKCIRTRRCSGQLTGGPSLASAPGVSATGNDNANLNGLALCNDFPEPLGRARVSGLTILVHRIIFAAGMSR